MHVADFGYGLHFQACLSRPQGQKAIQLLLKQALEALGDFASPQHLDNHETHQDPAMMHALIDDVD